MRSVFIILAVLAITATHVQAKPKITRRGKSTKAVKKRGAPTFIKKVTSATDVDAGVSK